MLVFAYSLVGLAAAATAISLVGPNVDLSIASLFYDPATGDFVAGKNSHYAWLRDHGLVAVLTCVVMIGLAIGSSSRWRLPGVPGRAAVFLAASLLLGPGLLVNGILKENWGRPRPGSIAEFGGKQNYVHWWNPRGTCQSNCSFASGEAATAAWMFGPAMLVPAPWRAAAMAGAAAFTVAMSVLRLASGGHFLTDVIFGALIAIAVLLAIQQLVFRWPWAVFAEWRGRRTDRGTSSSP